MPKQQCLSGMRQEYITELLIAQEIWRAFLLTSRLRKRDGFFFFLRMPKKRLSSVPIESLLPGQLQLARGDSTALLLQLLPVQQGCFIFAVHVFVF